MKITDYLLRFCLLALLIGGFAFAQEQSAADKAQELAKKLSNPIASLISVPLQMNYDTGFGPTGSGSRLLTNVQPVIPIKFSKDWNLISRTILPIVSQSEMFPGSAQQFGIGDILQSAFFSPSAPPAGGPIWGIGPVFLLPTATDDLLGGKKWGVGPTIVLLQQSGPQTLGLLMNHVWSFAGDEDRSDINSTYIQPFYTHTSKQAITLGLNTEASYNWDTEAWSIPINLSLAQLTKFVNQPVQLVFGLRYWLESPEGGPEGFGVRMGITYLFPK
jgi:hypothetical protein